MNSKRFHVLAEQFRQKHILVIGDLMLDSYMWGETNRISPEAPVPVVSIKEITNNPGGAANVGWNIATLSANVSLAGIIGKDSHGEQLRKIMADRGMKVEGVVEDPKYSTIVKTRVIAQNQQVIRTDFESLDGISSGAINTVQSSIEKNIKNYDAIILADYNKGLLSEKMITSILSLSNENNIPVYVDPKKENFFAFKGVHLFKPNSVEFYQSMDSNDPEKESKTLREKLNAEYVLVTLGAEGMLLTTEDSSYKIPTKARAVHDVSGAGDTVIATFALAELAGATPEEAATLANLAAGRVCEEVGVVPINLDLLTEILNHHHS